MSEAAAMLEVQALALRYGAAHALRGVSLTARRGEVTCVLGRNGVGKTSLLRSIVGRLPVDAGRIELDGEDVTSLPAWARVRAGMAIVPQGREIFPLLTVEENLQVGFGGLPTAQRSVASLNCRRPRGCRRRRFRALTRS